MFKGSLIRIVILVVLAATFIAPLAAFAAPAEQQSGQVAGVSLLNLRSGPGAGYPVVTVLSAGQQLTIIGRNADGTWLQVMLIGGTQGWVNARYVSIYSGGDVPTTAPTGVTSAYVTAYFLNLRSGPGANFDIIAKLSRYQGLNLIGRNADSSWVQVNVPGGASGWVSARYIAANLLINTLPVTSNTGTFPTFPQPVPTGGQTGIVTAYNLHVRYGPGVGFASFRTLSLGEGVSLIGRNGNGTWLLVQLANGLTGWVSSGFIRTSYPIASLPIRG